MEKKYIRINEELNINFSYFDSFLNAKQWCIVIKFHDNMKAHTAITAIRIIF